ncbi:MAG TPA: single-stranded DNA-binding protein [Solirubrobacterales bacterium]|nr:single-stranded DNA-binding protein [Solirubrobacterales bacterium]
MQNINVVVITGNLTRDPELRYTSNKTAVCEMRVAVNSRRKQGEEWVDKPHFFDVTVFGGRAEAIVQHLSKGSPIGIEGRLEWQEWEAKDGSGKRQSVKIIAAHTQFLGAKSRDDGETEDSEPEPAGVGAGAED